MKIKTKFFVVFLLVVQVIIFVAQPVLANNQPFTKRTITKNKPDQYTTSALPIPSRKIVEKGWLSRNKWWVAVGLALVAGGAAASAGGSGGGGDNSSDKSENQSGGVEVNW